MDTAPTLVGIARTLDAILKELKRGGLSIDGLAERLDQQAVIDIQQEERMAMNIQQILTALQTEADELTAKVAEQTDMTVSVKTALEGLATSFAATKQQLKEALDKLAAAGVDPATLAALEAAIARFDAQEQVVKANTDKLAKAVTDNVPPPTA